MYYGDGRILIFLTKNNLKLLEIIICMILFIANIKLNVFCNIAFGM